MQSQMNSKVNLFIYSNSYHLNSWHTGGQLTLIHVAKLNCLLPIILLSLLHPFEVTGDP